MLGATLFLCTVLTATDGDTLRCEDGTRVRLSAISAKELRTNACTRNHPCPAASAQAAKQALTKLVSGKVLRCQQVGTSYSRVVATCTVGGMDVSCAMVGTGTVLRWSKFDKSGRLRKCVVSGK